MQSPKFSIDAAVVAEIRAAVVKRHGLEPSDGPKVEKLIHFLVSQGVVDRDELMNRMLAQGSGIRS